MFSFENLRVYKNSLEVVDRVYIITASWPKEELFGLTNQLRRAIVSIALNIAEGSGRTKKDFRHFLDMSRSSCQECKALIQIAYNQHYITEKEYQTVCVLLEELAKQISSLKNSIKL